MRFNAVMDNVPQGLCFFGSDQRLILHNRRYSEIYGLSDEEIRPGMTLREILTLRATRGAVPDMAAEDYIAWTQEAATAFSRDGTVVRLRNGRVISIRYQPIPDGGYVATHEDITERNQAEARIVFMARHDALTQLPNRIMFHERLEQAVEKAPAETRYTVFCLGLDKFKLINETLGHLLGDQLLQGTATRLQACVRTVDTVARLSGDEFAILQLGPAHYEDAALLADKIIAAFNTPFDVDGHQIMIGISVGVALATADGASPDRALKNADLALSLAKVEGGNVIRFFEPGMSTRIQMQREQEHDLRAAIVRSEFKICYQPLVDLATGRITAFEALLRWNHPTRGLVAPSDFIPLAEETGVIVAIGAWVLRTACFEAKHWPVDIHLAVNLSPVQFKSGGFVDFVKEALDLATLPAERLELEITESILLQDTAEVLAALHQLRAMGVVIALDDFGTGYASLSYLRTFPFDKIKIDQAFVRDLTKNDEATSIVRAVVSLGRDLHMTTVAEGVETLEQLNRLREEGCTEAQGFIFSRPRPASELESLIQGLNGNFKPHTD